MKAISKIKIKNRNRRNYRFATIFKHNFIEVKKHGLRKIYLGKRLQLPETEYQNLNQALLQQFAKLNFAGITAVHIFLPMLRTKEPDTRLLIKHLQKEHPQIKRVFPKADFKLKTLSHFMDDEQLVITENEFGIPEPVSGNQFYIDKNSIIIVPLLAFDLNGNRVGYGGGFYDRFLVGCEAGTRFIGLSFFEPVDLIEDAGVLDVKLHQCITPESVLSFRR
ncbi:5-formyltetrahydrofolate cyclo-ligase [Mucilaginibacter arboris]|uniref:5-formyltetrahydrofolate cyclo-ligase n=1 Tax=Mucilaginibacter arboris TaxID=2682090 RepID=A0A7K1SST5_9SPHI|nr:5-formyltetrahydrofolate cyclo-ligase [Mucilaginibacter arboris]MVN20160.1 5-formyltetrahydrofolate cyclo-ligase [Mucilaginibacter arboris]